MTQPLSLATGNPEWEVALNPLHLLAITDDTGLFQHCLYSIPDRSHGYTLDDNARALIVSCRNTSPVLLSRLPVYLSFVLYCQRPDGLFRNFMGYDRRFLEEAGSPDSLGRALWAIGTLFRERPERRPLAAAMFGTFKPHLRNLRYLRSMAFAILGLHNYLIADPARSDLRAEAEFLGNKIIDSWRASNKSTDWQWFEESLTYENARLPQALFAAYTITGQSKFLVIARKAAAFLEKIHFEKGYLKLVGNRGWYNSQNQERAEFDEQPVDAGALVEMFATAYIVTGEVNYAKLASKSFEWYLGWNCLGLSLYDPVTGGCFDGLMGGHLNLNQGAESILSFLMAYQSLLEIKVPVNLPG